MSKSEWYSASRVIYILICLKWSLKINEISIQIKKLYPKGINSMKIMTKAHINKVEGERIGRINKIRSCSLSTLKEDKPQSRLIWGREVEKRPVQGGNGITKQSWKTKRGSKHKALLWLPSPPRMLCCLISLPYPSSDSYSSFPINQP